jgi:putative MATE family efflux protein
MRASGYPKKAMYTMLIGAFSNLILAPIFIFVLNLGIEGAAIATVISMTISATWVMTHFIKKNSYIRFKKKNFKLSWPVLWSIISIGMSPFFMQLATGFVNIIMNTSLKKYGGDLAVGAFGINSSLAILLIMFIIGLNQGMQPIAGYNYGAGLYDRAVKALKYSIYVSSIIAAAGTLCAVLIPDIIVRAFTTDPELLSIASNGLSIYLAAFFIVGFQAVTTNFFQCIGKAGKSIFLSLTRQCIVLIPCLLILPKHFGLNGVWAAGPISDLIAAALTALFLYYQIKSLQKTGLSSRHNR